MNNKGQSLVIVIICIPLIILLLGSVIEISNLYYNKMRIDKITRTIITNNIEKKNKDDIINLYHDNNIEYQNIEIVFNEGIEIILKVNINSFFGKLIGKDYYQVNYDIIGYQDGNKVKFKKGS